MVFRQQSDISASDFLLNNILKASLQYHLLLLQRALWTRMVMGMLILHSTFIYQSLNYIIHIFPFNSHLDFHTSLEIYIVMFQVSGNFHSINMPHSNKVEKIICNKKCFIMLYCKGKENKSLVGELRLWGNVSESLLQSVFNKIYWLFLYTFKF